MKRLFCAVFACFLLLTGCSATGERIKEPVAFYYICENFQKEMDQVIQSEVREVSGHRDDLPYLLALYSMGPTTEDLKSPFPRNTKMIPTERTSNSIELSLSEAALTLTDAEFTLASSCIALTCMELTNVEQVSVVCVDRKIVIQKDNLLLHNSMPK